MASQYFHCFLQVFCGLYEPICKLKYCENATNFFKHLQTAIHAFIKTQRRQVSLVRIKPSHWRVVALFALVTILQNALEVMKNIRVIVHLPKNSLEQKDIS